MKNKLTKLIDVKSIVTLLMTMALVAMLLVPGINPKTELLSLYCTAYGAVITYYFTRKDGQSGENASEVAEHG